MLEPSDLDPRAIRLQFGRRVRRLVDGDFLLREIERRMLERLDVVRIQPRCVVDVGTGLGHSAARLQQRYPQARVLGVDLAAALAAQAARLHGTPARRTLGARMQRWFGGEPARSSAPMFAACDSARLALGSASVDLLWSNLVFHWFVDPAAVIDEWHRVMRPEGLLTFSAFGVDTLRELREIGVRLPPMHDMHDIGDALAAAGFAEPVMDAERLTVSWRSAQAVLTELRGLGGDALRNRSRGLRGRAALGRWREAIEALAGADGTIALSFEIVYGHAWCPARKKRADGYVPIEFAPRGIAGRGR